MIRHVFKIVRNSWKIFCGIFIEQAVVFVVLMLVVRFCFWNFIQDIFTGIIEYG